MVEDWLANAYEGMSRRQFMALMSATGAGLAGFALAAKPVAGEIISTPTEGIMTAERTVMSGDFAEHMPELMRKFTDFGDRALKGKSQAVRVFGLAE